MERYIIICSHYDHDEGYGHDVDYASNSDEAKRAAEMARNYYGNDSDVFITIYKATEVINM